jgi:hypothetical protein
MELKVARQQGRKELFIHTVTWPGTPANRASRPLINLKDDGFVIGFVATRDGDDHATRFR